MSVARALDDDWRGDVMIQHNNQTPKSALPTKNYFIVCKFNNEVYNEIND